MSAGIIIPIVLLVLLLAGAIFTYRRFMQNLQPDDTVREVRGARLTSERLRMLASPPWRVVFEVPDDRLGGVDHVVIGPAGVIAISTLMFDRPHDRAQPDAQQMATAALLRAPVDELAQRAGLSCNLLAKVFWGTPQPATPAAIESGHHTVAVEGQRLQDWLLTLPPGPLSPAQVDLAWQTILTGIGRPDPLS